MRAHKKLLAEVEAAGATVVPKKKGYMVLGPKGNAMIHTTTSDHWALANARADIKRAGVAL